MHKRTAAEHNRRQIMQELYNYLQSDYKIRNLLSVVDMRLIYQGDTLKIISNNDK